MIDCAAVKIHEYQGKDILRKYGVPLPKGAVVFTPEEARHTAVALGGKTVVVKAQIHAGGRGKGGGVKVVKSPDEALEAAKKILGMQLVTHQTGPEGRVVGRRAGRRGTGNRARAVPRHRHRSIVTSARC